MAYVPGCRYDLFISYASENNREAWVEQFVQALGREVGDLLGRQFDARESVFFDKRDVEIAQSFPEKLVAAAKESAILVPLLSPGYLSSSWCDRERTEFLSELPDGAVPANCLAPVLVRPIDEGGLDRAYRDAQRLSFVGPDEHTPLPAGSADWVTQMRSLARQLKDALQLLRRRCKPVFLGKSANTERARKLRLRCAAELERRCFRVVPEWLPCLDDPDQVREHLQSAGLAIHFLGGADNAAMNALDLSVAVCTGATVVCQPFGTELAAEEQYWLGEFERDMQAGVWQYHRVAGKNDQELLAVIDDQIRRVPAAVSAGLKQADMALVCEELDLDGARRLSEDLGSRCPASIALPEFLATRLRAMERLRSWQDYFSRSGNQLFYHGSAERDRLELLWQTSERHRPGARRHWFLAPPDVDSKRQRHPAAMWSVDQVLIVVDQTAASQL